MTEATVVEPVVEEKNETKEEPTLLGKTADTTDVSALAETPEAKAARESKKATEAAAKVVPEKYELKVPEGMNLDNALMEKMTPALKEIGVTQDQAQKLADIYAPYVKAQVEAQSKAAMDNFKSITDGWKAETLKILGAEPDKTMAPAAKFLNTFGNSKVREVLDETGLGNHPELVQMFIKAGKMLGSDSFVDSSKTVTKTDNTLKVLYGTEEK